MAYLGPAALYDLLWGGVKLALQLAALLPVVEHLHLEGTELGAAQVNSEEVALLCNTSGQPSEATATERGPDATVRASGSPAPPWRVLGPGSTTREAETWPCSVQNPDKGIESLLSA